MKRSLFLHMILLFGVVGSPIPAPARVGTGTSAPGPLDASAPRILIEPLPPYTTLRGGDTIVFRWSRLEANPARPDSFHLATVRFEGAAVDSLRFSPGADSTAWAWTAPEVTSTGCFLAVAAVDSFGNVASATSDRFTVLTSATDVPAAAAAAELLPPRPNPFNPSTRIAFSLPEPGQTRIELFDARGRRVRLLAEGPRAAGEHAVAWDGTDDAGRRLAAGTYLVRLSWRGNGASFERSAKAVMVP